MFHDRREAGQRLAIELMKLQLHQPVILALPRGGVPVAAEVAKVLKAPLDLIIVRKVGAPGNCEFSRKAGNCAAGYFNNRSLGRYSPKLSTSHFWFSGIEVNNFNGFVIAGPCEV
ncbi:phosphoribosyltransferase family protein [Mesorhizobium sp. M0643]|uniref:phosphoribosyltransferase family protein n=2 Tax=Mesorhizobium TaxID=68287 RepID=UPI0033357D99